MSQQKVLLAELGAQASSILLLANERAPHDRSALVTLTGDLGAGKTTLVQHVAALLGVEGPVQSPTYVIMKTYEATHERFKTLVHIDAYRFDEPAQFSVLRPHEFMHDPSVLVCIEWPERLGNAISAADVAVKLSSEGMEENERCVEVG